MKICLPVEQPPITSFPTIANTLSILWGHKEKALPWLSDRLIQLVIRPNYDLVSTDFYDNADIDNYYLLLYGCPLLGWMRNNKTTALFNRFSDYIEQQIENGYYVEACLDHYYLKVSACYQKIHFIHTTFIYGFDREKQEVYVADFFDGKKYAMTTASYDEINGSIEHVDYIINLYKYQDETYVFNEKLMNMYLKDYLNSTDSLHKFEFSYQEHNRGMQYGLAYYDYVVSQIHDTTDIIDFRALHVLYDHKVLMKIRLEYLATLNKYDKEQLTQLILRTDQLIEETLIVRNNVLKYNVTFSKRILNDIQNKLEHIKSLDHDLVCSILKCTDTSFDS